MGVWRWFFAIILVISALATPQPLHESNTSFGANETRLPSSSNGFFPLGGNHSNRDVIAQTQTPFWQGVYGSVSNMLILQDAAGNLFYNWSRYNVTLGEVYFTNATTQFFDESITNATLGNITYAQMVLGWANSSGADNLTNTYNSSGKHQRFLMGTIAGWSLEVNASSAPSVNLQGGFFNATALWDSDWGGYPLWAALMSGDELGFTAREMDYEILLPVRAGKSKETYYVYVEFDG